MHIRISENKNFVLFKKQGLAPFEFLHTLGWKYWKYKRINYCIYWNLQDMDLSENIL